MLRIVYIPLLLWLNSVIACGNEFQYGLTFHSHEVNQGERTGLDLLGVSRLNLSKGFEIEFSLKLDSTDFSYGYVFRIISDDTSSLDFISHRKSGKINFVFAGMDHAFSNVDFSSQNINLNEWLKIKASINRHSIICSINDVSQEIPHSFENIRNVKIIFGSNKHPLFYTSDVPPMTVRDINIYNSKGKTLRNWPLYKHNENEVYDEIKQDKAVVQNGIWEIDKHAEWKPERTIPVFEKNAQISYDASTNRIFIATSDSLLIYNINNRQLDHIKTLKGQPFRSGGSQMLYDGKNEQLISYSILYPALNTYNFNTGEWSSDEIDEGLAPIQQHSRFLDTAAGQLILFGGYGNYRYKADLSIRDLNGSGWQTHDLSASIPPRYLSAMGWQEGKLLIMGGYGSISGKQEEAPKNFYDIYEIDCKTITCRKLLQFNPLDEPVSFGNSMIIEAGTNLLYALAYKNNFNSIVNLVSVNRENGEMKKLADSIPYNFIDNESFCDLYLNKEQSCFYAMFLQPGNSKQYPYVVNLYSLPYPSVGKSDIIQQPPTGLKLNVRIFIILCSATVLLAVIFFIYKKNTSPKTGTTGNTDSLPVQEERKRYNIEKKKTGSSILLLGGFQVFDKEGNDITDNFTPVLRQVFLFILLNSIKDGKKTISEKIDETFWMDMDKASAHNNRGVNIRKIRILLEKVGDIKLQSKNSYWYVDFGKDVFCDYYEIMALLKNTGKNDAVDKNLLEHILDIASAGVLLPNHNTDWLDDYKAEYFNLLLEVLMNAAARPEIRDDLKLLLNIANVILLHDSIDGFAVQLKCRTLFKLRQKGASKQAYNKYIKDLEHLLNAKPDFTYESIFANDK
jgi:two-component SAPR family response regulator